MDMIDKFLGESNLRSLKNLYWMPTIVQNIVLNNMDLFYPEKFCIKEYISNGNGMAWAYIWIRPMIIEYDDFENCYDIDYNLTTLGQEMKHAAIMVTQHE